MNDTMKAIIVVDKGDAQIKDVPIPTPGDDWVLVKTKAVALNPADWKAIDYGGADPGSKSGCDYSGIVVAVGKNVVKFRKGDRICGAVHGGDRCNHENGAYAEYVLAKACVQLRVPDDMSFEHAATLGVATITCGHALYQYLKLPLPASPASEPMAILIYAASTATGMAAVQWAKASGLVVVATSSPSNFEYLKLLGADAVFDYTSPTCAADIKAFTHNKLTLAFDCISGGPTVAPGVTICAAAMSDTEEGIYAAINPADEDLVKEALQQTNKMVQGPQITIGYDCFGDEYSFIGKTVPPKPEAMEYASRFALVAEDVLKSGAVKAVRLCIDQGGSGLEGVLSGLDVLRTKGVSGTKLVYSMSSDASSQ